MIAIVNYGSGNLQAIANIYARVGVPHFIASRPAELQAADRIVLPGVGAFDQTMRQLNESGMRAALEDVVLGSKKPLLGICVGMQLLARSSEEGSLAGLGWIDGEVRRFDRKVLGQMAALPHMGWNTAEPIRSDPIFEQTEADKGFYFLHSYYFSCRSRDNSLAETGYGITFASAVRRDNIVGVQFHPEKSHQNGVTLLKNFALS